MGHWLAVILPLAMVVQQHLEVAGFDILPEEGFELDSSSFP
jgi:hypothetical protein